jgi:hypothetical protein
LTRIGLIYEDEAIRIVVEILAQKILGEPVELEVLKGGAWPGIVGDIRNLLQILSIKHIATPLDCVLVVVDANGSGPTHRVQRLTDRVGHRQFRFGVPIYHAIVRHVETWLLGDHEAIDSAAGRALPVVHDPESLQDAKRHLIQVLKNSGARPYDRTFQRTAAQAVDVNRVSQKCPGFLAFVQKVKQCRQQRALFQEPGPENPH